MSLQQAKRPYILGVRLVPNAICTREQPAMTDSAAFATPRRGKTADRKSMKIVLLCIIKKVFSSKKYFYQSIFIKKVFFYRDELNWQKKTYLAIFTMPYPSPQYNPKPLSDRYDASTCIDAKKDPNVGDCSWVKPYCTQAMYRQWLEESCAKTCGYCRS